ncbi:MAG: hypothetical protein ACREBU_21840, partial [Nitrososphaera sp.]
MDRTGDSFLSFVIVPQRWMPEIWLRYGMTDVVLDIKFENLASHIASTFQPLPEEEIIAAFASVPLTDNMLLVSLSPSKAAAR